MGQYDTTIGPLLVGIFFNTYLYGLVTYQFAAYYRREFNDRPPTKYMVLFLFILDTFHTASVMYMAWSYTVTNYDNPAALMMAEWPYAFTPLATATASLVTQIYLGIRIWRLTNCRILYGVVILLAVPTFILGAACTVESAVIKVLSKLPRITPLVIAWVSMQLVVDIFITVTLVIIFSRSRTGFRKTDTILNRFIRGAIQTGLFASIFSLCQLITFVLLPDMNFYGMFAIPIGRIYTNTLLDTLLTRELLLTGTGATGNVTQSVVFDSLCWPPTDSQAISTVQSTSIQIKVERTTQAPCHRPSSADVEDYKLSSPEPRDTGS